MLPLSPQIASRYHIASSATATPSFTIAANGTAITFSPGAQLGNMTSIGNVVRTTNTNGNYAIVPNGSGKVSVGTSTAAGSKVGVNSNVSIGASYYTLAAPGNGMIVQGTVCVGTSAPIGNANKLTINGRAMFRSSTAGSANVTIQAVDGSFTPRLRTYTEYIQTTGTALTTALTIPTTAGRHYQVFARISTVHPSSSYRLSAVISGLFGATSTGPTTAQIGTLDKVVNRYSTAGMTATVAGSGLSLLFRVAGVTGQTLNWSIVADVVDFA